MLINTSDIQISDVNINLLIQQIKAAASPDTEFKISVSYDPFVFEAVFPDSISKPEVVNIINSHVSTELSTKEQVESATKGIVSGVGDQISNIPEYFTWDAAEGNSWIDTNVTDLASAKLAIKKLWQMNVAMRDRLFAKEVAKLRNP